MQSSAELQEAKNEIGEHDTTQATRTDYVVAWVAIGVLAIWIAWMFGLGQLVAARFADSNVTAMASAGQFGDMFGSINALFTALAFVAVWWTGRMQQRELALQRQELRLQRQAIALQRVEMAGTRAVISRQTFESMFFQMLRLTRELREHLPSISYDGRSFDASAPKCKGILERYTRGDVKFAKTPQGYEALRMEIGESYVTHIYNANGEATLGPYFRSLYHLFKLIDGQPDLPNEVKREYANVARAHLSADDLILLAVNGCSPAGEGFRKYIEIFGLLKHYPDRGAGRHLFEGTIYRASAFQGADGA